MGDGLIATSEKPNAALTGLATHGASPQGQHISLRQLLGDVLVYGMASVADRAIGFLLLPIMTAILMPADYGIMSLFTTTSHILFILCSLGIHQGFFRFYTEENDSAKQLQILNTSLVLAIGYWLLLLPVFLVFRRELNLLIFGIDGSSLSLALAAAMLIQVIDSVASNRLQADGRRWAYFAVVVTNSIVLRTVAILLVLQGMGAWGWVLSDTLGRLVAVVLLVVVAMPDASFKASAKLMKPMATYGVFLVPALISYYVMIVSDKYLIRALSANPLQEVGFYSVGERISSAMQLVNLAFIFGWQRFAFRNMHHPEGPQVIARGILWFAIGGGFFALALAMLGDDLTRLLIARAYAPGIVVIAPLTLAALLGGLASASEIGLHKRKRPLHISYLNGAAAVLNITLNWWAIPRWGIAGAAYATMFCQFVRLFIIWWAANVAFPLPFETRRLFHAVSMFLVIYFLGQTVSSGEQWSATMGQALLIMVTPALMWAFGILTPQEKAAAMQFFHKFRSIRLS
jgi:O-antigen/teichoic acid export membrane protein